MGRRRKGEEVPCNYCGTFTRNKKYCSESCQHNDYRKLEEERGNRVELICVYCHGSFKVHKSDLKIHPNKRYCSRICKDEHQRILYSGEGNPLFGKTATNEELLLRKCKSMLNSAKSRAKRENLQFDITVDDIVIPERCPLLDIPLFNGNGSPCSNSPSLDRIDSTKGYIKGNVHVISYRANTIKQDATLEELFLLTERLKNIWQKLN